MQTIFGEIVNAPAVKLPLTTKERAARLQAKIDAKTPPPFDPSTVNLSSFPAPDTRAAFIGQNIYIKPSYLVSIPEYCYFNRFTGEVAPNPRTLTADFIKNQENLKDNETGGELSRKAVTGLKNSINWLCMSAKRKRVFRRGKYDPITGKWNEPRNFYFKVNFVTLTLPDTTEPVSAKDLQKNLLNPWLTYFRKFHNLKNYVWRLELQKNGKLHVHLTCDTFLHHRIVRDTWNRLMDKHGYLSQFVKDHKHKDPNSTDIHATRKVKNLVAYLAKYMSKKGTKTSEDKTIKGRLWGCSRDLSRANKTRVHVPADACADELKCLMNPTIEYKELTAGPAKNSNYISPYAAPGIIEPRKIGELFLLRAGDWVTKITGTVRRAFDQTREMLSGSTEAPVFELA